MAARRPRIILASTSPRRIELLTQLGLAPKVIAPHTDETVLPGEKPRALVRRLAQAKALSVTGRAEFKGKLPSDTVVLAADTIVVLGGRILNKPGNAREARSMLKSLSGRRHEVLTGYCLISNSKQVVRVVSSKVRIARLSKHAIASYVATGEPMDKAGAYAAQGMGMGLIEGISGSYANVVGLPVAQVIQDLSQSFGFELFKWL